MHKPASLYKAFPSAEARRIIKRLGTHYTPKHESWLDMAEIELKVMTRQCLARRIEDIRILWEEKRNNEKSKNLMAFLNRGCPEKTYIIISCIHN